MPKKSFSFATTTASLIVGLGIATASPSLAVTIEEVPNPRQTNGGWVTDMADVLTPETETQLNQIISQLESQNGSEIAVVTVPNTTPSPTPKEFATTLFNHWHIGKNEANNGVLFLISPNERRVEIETGTGLQTILPNQKVSDIIQQQIVPHFKTGDYNSGTIAGANALVVALETSSQPISYSVSKVGDNPISYSVSKVGDNPISYSVSEVGDNPIPWYVWLGGVGAGVLGIELAARYSKNNRSKSNTISTNKSRSSPNSTTKANSSKSGVGFKASTNQNGSQKYNTPSTKKQKHSSHSYTSDSTSFDSGSSYSSDYGSSSSSSSYDSGSSYSSSDFGGGSSDGGGGGDSY